MAPSERYIAPSDKELQRRKELQEAAKQFDHQREALLTAALKKCKKVDLVSLMARIAKNEKHVEWIIEQEIGFDKPVPLLAHDIERAIDLATKVDERRHNYNFDYDWQAYEAVCHGLSRLVQKNAFEEAKRLALKLMDKGSYQIECSDEGLMHEEIEACLQIVISAVSNLPGTNEWAQKMRFRDRVGTLCYNELTTLAKPGQ